MYRVTIRQGWNGAEQVIHSDTMNGPRLISAKITKDVSSIDSFVFTISPRSEHYGELIAFTTFVKVVNTKLNKVLFEGRVLPSSDSMESSGLMNKEVTCEGLLAFLHDSVQDYYALSNNDLVAFLQHMIDVHNGQVDGYKQIRLGQVTVTSPSDNVYKSIDDSQTTYDTIKDKLIGKYGGELRLRHEPDGLYLDYMPIIGSQGIQQIKLTSNLLSVKRALDPSKAYSVIKPLGATIESNTDDTTTSSDISKPRVTIQAVNNGGLFLYDQSMINRIGFVVHPEVWDDVKEPAILKSKAQAMLNCQKAVTEQFQVSAVDLSLLRDNPTTDSFDLGNYYQTINPLMGLNESLRLVGLSLDICEPLNSTLTIGDKALTQEDYDLALQHAANQVITLNARIESANSIIGTLTTQAKDLNQSIADQNKIIEILQQDINNADLTGFSSSLKDLKDSLKTLSDQVTGLNFVTPTEFTNYQTTQTKLITNLTTRLEVLEGGQPDGGVSGQPTDK